MWVKNRIRSQPQPQQQRERESKKKKKKQREENKSASAAPRAQHLQGEKTKTKKRTKRRKVGKWALKLIEKHRYQPKCYVLSTYTNVFIIQPYSQNTHFFFFFLDCFPGPLQDKKSYPSAKRENKHCTTAIESTRFLQKKKQNCTCHHILHRTIDCLHCF